MKQLELIPLNPDEQLKLLMMQDAEVYRTRTERRQEAGIYIADLPKGKIGLDFQHAYYKVGKPQKMINQRQYVHYLPNTCHL